MKYLIIVGLLILSSCTSKNQYGDCIGLNQKENPKLKYQYSAGNIAVAVVFAEMVAPPIIVLLNELKCPVGEK